MVECLVNEDLRNYIIFYAYVVHVIRLHTLGKF